MMMTMMIVMMVMMVMMMMMMMMMMTTAAPPKMRKGRDGSRTPNPAMNGATKPPILINREYKLDYNNRETREYETNNSG